MDKNYKWKQYHFDFNGRHIATEYHYEYRGHDYSVIYYHNGCNAQTPKDQHEIGKYRIDKMLDAEPNYNGKGTDEDLKDFFDLIEGE